MSPTSQPSEVSLEEISVDLHELTARIEALEAENERLREELEAQLTVEFRGNNEATQIEDLWIGGLPIGMSVANASQRGKRLNTVVFGSDAVSSGLYHDVKSNGALIDRVDETSESTGSAALTEDVRKTMLPIHEMWLDIVHGREDRLGANASPRRGARLFGRIVRRAENDDDDELRLLVDVTEQHYVLRSTDAQEILEADADPTHAAAQTVKRAMQAVDQFANGLIQFDDTAKVNKLITPKTELHEAMENVQVTIHDGDSDTKSLLEQTDNPSVGDLMNADDCLDHTFSNASMDGGEKDVF